MGKTKHMKEKKFDRNVEISAPILDPEVIKKIHSSPPQDKRPTVKGYGFEALLTDLNSQDSTEEVAPIIQPSHLPSYIGISCAVSGYSNYSAYNRRPEAISTQKIELSKPVTKPIKSTKLSSTPTRSQTDSPASNRIDPSHIHHITIDKSHIESADQERKELTEKLTASVSDRRRSPSPLAPLEDERHHGAYVGARYCPMPAPSKLVHKHIPLLGIDDDQDPDQVVVEDKNKVEEKIASLYGDEFVEGWKESMSHKSKREDFEDEQRFNNEAETIKSPKSLVTLKPTPPKIQDTNEEVKYNIDVQTPNVKVLEGVEKQFLNKLLTDDNPPMPKAPSPLPKSPSPQPTYSTSESTQIIANDDEPQKDETSRICEPSAQADCTSIPHELVSAQNHGLEDPPNQAAFESNDSIHSESNTPEKIIYVKNEEDDEGGDHAVKPISPVGYREGLIDYSKSKSNEEELDQREHQLASLQERVESPAFNQESPPPQSMLIDLGQQQLASDTQDLLGKNEQHIEYAISTQSPIDNQSSPVKVVEQVLEGNLVSFSPEPSSMIVTDDLEAKTTCEYKLNADEKLENLGNLLDLAVNSEEAPQVSTHEQSICQDEHEAKPSDLQTALSSSIPHVDNNNKDGHYYLDLLRQEEEFLGEQVRLAEHTLSERESSLDEDTLGKIRSAIGKANLLINKKCNQFRELCKQGINADANEQYAVLNDDLAGFWDMLSIQINDVKKSFESLENIILKPQDH